MSDHWIQGAIKHPGALHRELGVPQGQKIPAKKLAAARHSKNPTLRRRANLARTSVVCTDDKMPKDMAGVMHEFKHGQLHSGSKHGPVVKNRKQAIAIGLSEQRQLRRSPSRRRGR